jgi:cytoskeletal protein RodZ
MMMTTDTDIASLSFGRYLQAIRLEKGISLEAVSKETRIRKTTLIQIEEDDFEKLPDETFVKGFLRAYAKAIGADEQEAVRRYCSRLDVIKKINKSEYNLNRTRKNFWARLGLSIGTLLCLIFLSVLFASFLRSRPPTDQQVANQKEQQIIKDSKDETDSGSLRVPVPVENPVDKKIPEKFFLKIITIEETWLKVIIDNQDSNEYSLNPGDQIELEATNGYNLLIGNAGGIQLVLNDKPLEVPGKSGQVVNVQIP